MVLERSIAPEPTASPMKKLFLFVAISFATVISGSAALDTTKIDNLTGLKGKLNEKAGAMVMGDTVLFEDEVNPAMSAALDNGLSVTALHNHFFFDQPKVYFMHIAGEGSTDDLARAIRKVYDKIKEIRAAT